MIRFLADGKTEANISDNVDLIWTPLADRRFRVTRTAAKNGKPYYIFYIFEISQDGKEAIALNLPGVVDAKKRLCLHQTTATTIEGAELESLKKLIVEQPDKLTAQGIPHDLAKRSRRKALEFLFDNGIPVDIREKESWRWTPLMFAIKEADLATVAFLLDRGANLNALDIRNAPPLFVAAERGDNAIVGLLLDRGANLNTSVSWINHNRNDIELGTALSVAARGGNLETCKLLIARGASINAISEKNHETPLTCALVEDHFEVAKELLKLGADPNPPNHGTVNPLRIIAYQGNVEMTRQLLAHGAKADMQSSERQAYSGLVRTEGAVLHVSARGGYLAVANVLLESGCPVDQTSPTYLETPLHAAALAGNTAICKWLLEKGADPQHRLADNIGPQSGWTPLHSAAWRGSLEVMSLLMTKGASPADACTDDGLRRTAFQLACLKGWLPVVQLIFAQPAYQAPEARRQLLAMTDKQGNTALHMAVSCESDADVDVVKLLISSGAPLDIANGRGLTPAQLAVNPELGTRFDAARRLLMEQANHK